MTMRCDAFRCERKKQTRPFPESPGVSWPSQSPETRKRGAVIFGRMASIYLRLGICGLLVRLETTGLGGGGLRRRIVSLPSCRVALHGVGFPFEFPSCPAFRGLVSVPTKYSYLANDSPLLLLSKPSFYRIRFGSIPFGPIEFGPISIAFFCSVTHPSRPENDTTTTLSIVAIDALLFVLWF